MMSIQRKNAETLHQLRDNISRMKTEKSQLSERLQEEKAQNAKLEKEITDLRRAAAASKRQLQQLQQKTTTQEEIISRRFGI